MKFMSWPHHVYFKTYLFFGLSHSSEGQSAYLDYLSQVACLFICLSVCSHIPSAWCCPTVLPTELRMIVFILCLDQKFSFNLNFIYLLLCLHMTCKEKQTKKLLTRLFRALFQRCLLLWTLLLFPWLLYVCSCATLFLLLDDGLNYSS